MMNAQDRQAIEQVFTQLQTVAQQAGPRDAEAEAMIQARMQAQPGSAYFMAQTVVVQQQALENAQRRIQELEQKLRNAPPAAPQPAPALNVPQAPADAGFGRSAFGRSAGQTPPAAAVPPPAQGFGRSAGGGGFLAGAAQTALGVAGGMMLGSLLGGLFGGNSAEAAETPADSSAADTSAAEPMDDAQSENWDDGAGFDDMGGDDY